MYHFLIYPVVKEEEDTRNKYADYSINDLYSESVAAGLSGGAYFDVQPGGKGTMTMTHKMIGPFS